MSDKAKQSAVPNDEDQKVIEELQSIVMDLQLQIHEQKRERRKDIEVYTELAVLAAHESLKGKELISEFLLRWKGIPKTLKDRAKELIA